MGKQRQFLVDASGQKIAVVISIQEYQEMLEELEDIEALREFEEAKASGETSVPLDVAIARIERNRK